LGVAEQADDDLLVAFFLVPVVAEGDQTAVRVFALDVSAGDVVEHHAAVFQMLGGELFLDGGLAFQQAVEGRVAMLVDVGPDPDAAQFPETGVGGRVAQA